MFNIISGILQTVFIETIKSASLDLFGPINPLYSGLRGSPNRERNLLSLSITTALSRKIVAYKNLKIKNMGGEEMV